MVGRCGEIWGDGGRYGEIACAQPRENVLAAVLPWLHHLHLASKQRVEVAHGVAGLVDVVATVKRLRVETAQQGGGDGVAGWWWWWWFGGGRGVSSGRWKCVGTPRLLDGVRHHPHKRAVRDALPLAVALSHTLQELLAAAALPEAPEHPVEIGGRDVPLACRTRGVSARSQSRSRGQGWSPHRRRQRRGTSS